jgi:multidrug efflux pump subunit AcrB
VYAAVYASGTVGGAGYDASGDPLPNRTLALAKQADAILLGATGVIADARIQQALVYPEFDVKVDRSWAQELGFSQQSVANDLLFSLTGSFQTNQTFWLDRKGGVSYPLVAQTPQSQLDSLDAFRNIPPTGAASRLVRSADALDPAARTLLVELEADNAKGELFPGSYTDVQFELSEGCRPRAVRWIPVRGMEWTRSLIATT